LRLADRGAGTLAEKLLEVPQELIRTALDLELQEGTVVADRVGETPCIFLAGLHRAERAECNTMSKRCQDLVQAFMMRTYAEKQAREYSLHGFARAPFGVGGRHPHQQSRVSCAVNLDACVGPDARSTPTLTEQSTSALIYAADATTY
jgi:hypothetical protein